MGSAPTACGQLPLTHLDTGLPVCLEDMPARMTRWSNRLCPHQTVCPRTSRYMAGKHHDACGEAANTYIYGKLDMRAHVCALQLYMDMQPPGEIEERIR